MGDIAMQIIKGEVCQECTMHLAGGAVGYPRLCIACGGDAEHHPAYTDDCADPDLEDEEDEDWLRNNTPYEPDEAQEWHDYDPDC